MKKAFRVSKDGSFLIAQAMTNKQAEEMKTFTS